MPITHLRAISVPKGMQATRMTGVPVDNASVIRRDATIPVLHQSDDGSFKPVETVQAATVPEPRGSDPLPPDAATQRSKAEFQVAVDSPLPAPAKPTPQALPAAMPAPQAPATAPPSSRVRVRLSNQGMGRVTVSVRAVSISDSVILLVYPPDADNIVEPPICGVENPIKVEYNGNSYWCVFGGWTTELDGSFLVILLRADDEAPSKT